MYTHTQRESTQKSVGGKDNERSPREGKYRGLSENGKVQKGRSRERKQQKEGTILLFGKK